MIQCVGCGSPDVVAYVLEGPVCEGCVQPYLARMHEALRAEQMAHVERAPFQLKGTPP